MDSFFKAISAISSTFCDNMPQDPSSITIIMYYDSVMAFMEYLKGKTVT